MASPQVELGFTRIANELFNEVIRYRCTSIQKEIILFVIRFTYGFNRKDAPLSVRFISTGINRPYQKVSPALKELIRKNVVIIKKDFSTKQNARILSLNKNYEKWEGFNSPPNGEQLKEKIKKDSLQISEQNSSPNGEQHSPPKGEQRKKTLKKTLKKDSLFENIKTIISDIISSEIDETTLIKFHKKIVSNENLCSINKALEVLKEACRKSNKKAKGNKIDYLRKTFPGMMDNYLIPLREAKLNQEKLELNKSIKAIGSSGAFDKIFEAFIGKSNDERRKKFAVNQVA